MDKRKFYVSSNDLWDIYDQMEQDLGSEYLAMAIAKALGTNDLEDVLRFIDRMEYANELFTPFD
tara:strand:- start:8110 stop:8301 length:192 start_codon:yes stop_codon:yes gene_type:complete